MQLERRSLLVGTGTVAMATIAGCSGSADEPERTVEITDLSSESSLDGSTTFQILVRAEGGPFEARVYVTIYDENNQIVEELVKTVMLEDGSQMVTVEGDVPSSAAHYEAKVEET